jgi:hypothetical protein
VNFVLWPARAEAEDGAELPREGISNFFRGALGAALHGMCQCRECGGGSGECIYRRYFKPQWREGPSGYRDAPRPFVLRMKSFGVEVVSFELNPPWPMFEQAFAKAGLECFNVRSRICLPMIGEPAPGKLRVEFRTPTEIKEGGVVLEQPEFAPLIRRLAERVQALGTLYQGWPAEWNLREALAGAEDLRLAGWQWSRTETFRRSSTNGAVHSIGGFTGWAEYEGPVGKFRPLLEIGRWTGVGRQTMWGKGEIRVTD